MIIASLDTCPDQSDCQENSSHHAPHSISHALATKAAICTPSPKHPGGGWEAGRWCGGEIKPAQGVKFISSLWPVVELCVGRFQSPADPRARASWHLPL